MGSTFHQFQFLVYRSVNESAFYIAIAASFFGFFFLAYILLMPVYRFIKREEKRSEAWTTEAIAARQQALEKERAAAEVTADEPSESS